MTGRAGIRTVAVMTMTTNEALDPAAVEEFAGRIFGLLTGSMITYMIDLGHRTGLFDAVAKGPGTSDEIADRAGLNERYVREWLGAVVTGGKLHVRHSGMPGQAVNTTPCTQHVVESAAQVHGPL